MISKLIAWAEDRPLAIARMRRALAEYVIVGIRTTLPFFTWLFEQPDFLAARFDTTYLDDLLKRRNGQSFAEATPSLEDVAAVAAAVQAAMASTAGEARSERAGLWKTRAREEGLG
jgi:acetyl-CoA carboxylase, biotin carboxylase subunit